MVTGGGAKKLLDLRRGLFLIRYESAEDALNPPRLVVSEEGWAPSDLEIILQPGTEEPVLWSPGGCLVIRASREGRLIVSVVPSEPTGSTVASVQLEHLSAGPLGDRPAGTSKQSEIKVLGHLSGIRGYPGRLQRLARRPFGAGPRRGACY